MYVYINIYTYGRSRAPGPRPGHPLYLGRGPLPGRPSGAPWNSESAQGRSKTGQDRCQTAQEASRTPREGRRSVPKRPKAASRRAKRPSRRPKRAPRGPPRQSQEANIVLFLSENVYLLNIRSQSAPRAPRGAQGGPKTASDSPNTAQEGPKTAQGTSKATSVSPKRAPREFQERSKKGRGALSSAVWLPTCPEDSPGGLLDAPKKPPEAPEMPPRGAGRLPRGHAEASMKSLRIIPRGPQRHPICP